LLINDVLDYFKSTRNIYLKNQANNEKWFWTKDQLAFYFMEESLLSNIFYRIVNGLKIIMGIALVSNVTAIYIKVTVICAPIFLIFLRKL
jgi:hypothetical protein